MIVKGMSKENFGSLENRKIMDAFRIEQECINSMKKNNMMEIILKMDLVKG